MTASFRFATNSSSVRPCVTTASSRHSAVYQSRSRATTALISGDLASVRMEAGRVSLGAVRVLGRMIQGTSWSEADGAPNPPADRAFFYLVQYRDARGPTGFGAESVPLPREPSSCDAACPGREAEYLAAAGAGPRKR